MVKNGKLSRAISETPLEKIQNVSRMDRIYAKKPGFYSKSLF